MFPGVPFLFEVCLVFWQGFVGRSNGTDLYLQSEFLAGDLALSDFVFYYESNFTRGSSDVSHLDVC